MNKHTNLHLPHLLISSWSRLRPPIFILGLHVTFSTKTLGATSLNHLPFPISVLRSDFSGIFHHSTVFLHSAFLMSHSSLKKNLPLVHGWAETAPQPIKVPPSSVPEVSQDAGILLHKLLSFSMYTYLLHKAPARSLHTILKMHFDGTCITFWHDQRLEDIEFHLHFRLRHWWRSISSSRQWASFWTSSFLNVPPSADNLRI